MKPSTILILAGLALTSISCSQSGEHIAAGNRVRFGIAASTDATRTQWGELTDDGYAVEWSEDDRLKIILSTTDNIGEAAVEHLSSDRLTARFSVDMTLQSQPAEYEYYACCPSSAFRGACTPAEYPESDPRIEFTVPPIQSSAKNSFDPDAAVIFGRANSGDMIPETLEMSFTSIVAYGKISIKDLPLDAGERVVSITLAASQPISGDAEYRFDDADACTVAAAGAQNSIEIGYDTEQSTFSAWFTSIPASLRDGWLCVCVKTDRGRFEKMIRLTGKEFVLQRNSILSFTVDMSPARRSEYPVWHRVSSPEDISDGTYAIICDDRYCSNDTDDLKHPYAVAIADSGLTIDGDILYGDVKDRAIWDFTTAGDLEFAVSKHEEPAVRLYASNTSNGIYVDDNDNRRFNWRFSTEGGAMRATCRNNSDTRYLGVNSSGWRSYTSYTNTNYTSSEIELFARYVE